jgi:ATP-dependent helicase/nuclease subunit A
LAWLRTAQTEVKRDMEITRDEVRVMTVHGAKGLEAPIVILADTTTPPAGPPHGQPRLLELASNAADGPPQFVWAGRKAYDVAPVSTARTRLHGDSTDEYRRLLYVAMTRASQRLIVCGAEGERRRPPGCWFDLIADALLPDAVEMPDDGEGKVWQYSKVPASGVPTRRPISPKQAVPSRPGWLERDATAARELVLPLSPSRAYDESISPPAIFRKRSEEGAFNRTKAIARGILIHRLLQSLPDMAQAARREAAMAYLARNGRQFSAEERESMVAQVSRLLDDTRFCQLFAPGSRAELPIVGRFSYCGRMLAVSGQVDRLAVSGDAVLIGDFKTNRPAPHRLEDVPAAYICQLALYRAALLQLYPGKAVRAALLWTEVPDLMEIPAGMMEEALATVTSP